MSPPSQEANTLFPKSGALSHDSTLPATRNRRDLSTSTSTPAAQILMNIQTNLAAQKERSAQSSAPSPSILVRINSILRENKYLIWSSPKAHLCLAWLTIVNINMKGKICRKSGKVIQIKPLMRIHPQYGS